MAPPERVHGSVVIVLPATHAAGRKFAGTMPTLVAGASPRTDVSLSTVPLSSLVLGLGQPTRAVASRRVALNE